MDNTGIEHFFSPEWFFPSTFTGFDWVNPIFLYLIAALPLFLLVRWLINRQTRQKLEIALPEDKARKSNSALLRLIPPTFLSLTVLFVLIALSRPQRTNEQVEQYTEGIDIMLVMDISESMQIEDFVPNRLEAAKSVGKDFINGRFQDRIGLVIFSGEAISYSPLTTDYELLNTLIDDISFNMVRKGGTAIGLAIGVTINRMKDSNAKSKVMILLSDGENTAGSIDPETAAKIAKDKGIKMYTIGVGKEGKVPYGTDMFGRKRYIEQSLDESTLRMIADLGDGRYFRATNNQALDEIFGVIDQYEKAEIKETRFQDTKDYYFIYLFYGILFFLLWLATKNTFMVNALED
ncbi:vWA domain-containing protein [Chondrinema litorale]|uniref:vWA domain-containing protein n=1 Tax=Chondrinema litorale TaxID=2994555 RepID=UPI002542DEAB|nr:VWA domain-containing protein [Chondrinema litorale]UZR95355.1 VWA domain-containing protein [Chondrinema litorale]